MPALTVGTEPVRIPTPRPGDRVIFQVIPDHSNPGFLFFGRDETVSTSTGFRVNSTSGAWDVGARCGTAYRDVWLVSDVEGLDVRWEVIG